MHTIEVNINDLDYKAMAHEVMDVDEWVQAAVSGKINNCRKRIRISETQRLVSDPSVNYIPPTEDAILESMFTDINYKDRSEREMEIENTK